MNRNPESWSVYVGTIKSLTLALERSRIVSEFAADELINDEVSDDVKTRLIEIVENLPRAGVDGP